MKLVVNSEKLDVLQYWGEVWGGSFVYPMDSSMLQVINFAISIVLQYNWVMHMILFGNKDESHLFFTLKLLCAIKGYWK